MVDKEEREYTCGYCGHNFKRKVGTACGPGGGKHSRASDQVKCKRCNNFLRTWE